MTAPLAPSLDLGLVGNGTFGALFDARARLVWSCLPAFDGDPAFCALLSPHEGHGDWSIELEDFERSEQSYIENTAKILAAANELRAVIEAQPDIIDFRNACCWRCSASNPGIDAIGFGKPPKFSIIFDCPSRSISKEAARNCGTTDCAWVV